ncbi:MAG: exonuclease domain-containing protein [Gammaproteobacteria bacterium]
MRKIFLDTETTGLGPEFGHRIVEIVALAFSSRGAEPEEFHSFCNPQREIDAGAEKIHGINAEFLADKPLFCDIAPALRDFLREGEILIHNAKFDCDFLDAEFARCDLSPVAEINPNITCTMEMSKRKNSGLRHHSLDNLCRYYEIDASERVTHNALLDARLLAKVYFAMSLEQMPMGMPSAAQTAPVEAAAALLQRADDNERAAHETYLDAMEKELQAAREGVETEDGGAGVVWRR